MLKEAAPYVGHDDLASYADAVVNLKKEDVEELRQQVNRLRDELADYIKEHPAYSLVKMLHSGSVAKGTALSDLNDMDVAVYIKKAAAPEEKQLIHWMSDRLKEALWRLKPNQFKEQTHCVTVTYVGTGLNVDVVPVLYEGLPDDMGYLIVKDTGDRLLTSVPMHLRFIRRRKTDAPRHYAQVVRFVKWWAKQHRGEFRFKSFIAELLVAKLLADGVDVTDYPSALEQFFTYIVKSGLKERVFFTDNYPESSLPKTRTGDVEIFDPVNPENNVAKLYTDKDRRLIVENAHAALDAIEYGLFATTKGRATETWQRIFGSTFGAF